MIIINSYSILPTGVELATTANATSDPNGNEANATTGFTNALSSNAVESTIVNNGSYSLKNTSSGTGPSYAGYAIPGTEAAGETYTVTFYARGDTGSSAISAWQNCTGGPVSAPVTEDVWTEYIYNIEATGDGAELRFYSRSTGSAVQILYIDNLSVIKKTPVGVTSAYIEAEDYDTLGGEWQDDGTTITAIGGIDSGAPVYSDSARRVEYTTPYLQGGDYTVWISMTNGTNNTTFVAMDKSDDTFLAVNDTASDYDWDAGYSNSEGNDLTTHNGLMVFYSVNPGVHTIELYRREAATIDKIYITKNLDTPV